MDTPEQEQHMDPEVIDVLKRARERIRDKERWYVGALCDCEQRVCVMGAINVAHHGSAYWGEGDGLNLLAGRYLNTVARRIWPDLYKHGPGPMDVGAAVAVNNTLGHSAVMLLLDTAIGDGGLDSPCEDAEHAKAAVEKA